MTIRQSPSHNPLSLSFPYEQRRRRHMLRVPGSFQRTVCRLLQPPRPPRSLRHSELTHSTANRSAAPVRCNEAD
ncbi:hypothetical protein XELAEV_18034487mg [Xenopus laevis]|uniref:Uncharacterized protein n=1 Tax=Xenopus laevis TaxID=8355 RepID=A0A974CF10_XENLA|nr:hypothetical protein XELAEV_18034487mg [Xenopus laevis]